MTSAEAKVPDNETADWNAIDIFVFSNGQQYSPPRKYHLRAEDLNWWKSTLNFLARTQYGTLYFDTVASAMIAGRLENVGGDWPPERHSYIDLYTIDGTKIVSPLELSNGAPYVAVAPHDRFVDAGYDKYLLRASRSWEKRQAKKLSVAEPEKSNKNTEIAHFDGKVEDTNNRLNVESVDLKTIVSSMVDHETSVIVQPQTLSTVQQKLEPLHATPAKLTERKRPSIQRPSIAKKNSLPPPPAPNMKTALKKRDIIKTGNVKISRPEGGTNSSSASGTHQIGKIIAKSKPVTRPKETSLTPKVYEPESERKSTSLNKITTNNDTNLLTKDVNIDNIIADQEILLVSNVYQNPRRDMSSVAVNPNNLQHIEPIGNQTVITIPVENVKTINEKDVNNLDNLIENNSTNPTQNSPNYVSPLRRNSIKTENNSVNTTQGTAMKVKQYTNTNNETKVNAMDEKENIKIYNNSSPQIISIMTGILSEEKTAHHVKKNTNVNNSEIISNEPNENVQIHNIPMKQLGEGASISNSQFITHEIIHNVDENIKLNNEILTNAHKNNKTQKNIPTLQERTPDNRYAVLNKGDVVNLKFNIEIQSYDGGLIKISDHANLHSVTNIQRTEKGSQINVTHQMFAQNKSLLSLIAKEINDHHIGDNNLFIVVQCSGCKYCNEQNAAMQDKNINKNYMILFPEKKFEENALRCYCDYSDRSQHEVQRSSLSNPVKATISCMSIERLTKLTQMELPVETISQIIALSHPTTVDKVLLETKRSDNDVIAIARKKSVTICTCPVEVTHTFSKISHEISVETALITVNKEVIEAQHLPVFDISTQTDWCEILLEARLLEDGHYTFRLPPLEVLKNYKLI